MHRKSGALELWGREGLWNFRLLGVLILPSFVLTKDWEYSALNKMAMVNHGTLWDTRMYVLYFYSGRKVMSSKTIT